MQALCLKDKDRHILWPVRDTHLSVLSPISGLFFNILKQQGGGRKQHNDTYQLIEAMHRRLYSKYGIAAKPPQMIKPQKVKRKATANGYERASNTKEVVMRARV